MEEKMSTEPVLVERDGHIAIVTLNDPDTLNALSTEMMQELGRVWPELDADPKCRVVVLTGAGERGFCSGLRAQNIDTDPGKRPAGYPRFTPRQCGLWKPVVVAVNGTCASGGLHFLSHAEIAIASETARFLDTHVTVGQVSGLEATCLARRIPVEVVLRMVVLGRSERLDAQKALQLGLVSEVLPQDQLLDRALELARVAASNSPHAIRHSLQALWEGLNMGLDDALTNAWNHIVEHRSHPDSREGGRAFLEKRTPNWQD
jgi:enoyl-CoA hydratase/carnithine racemase